MDVIKKDEIVNNLYNATYWISEMVSGDLGDEDNHHIRDMVDSIDEAIGIISQVGICVDAPWYENEDGVKVYDEDHIREEFERKLSILLNA